MLALLRSTSGIAGTGGKGGEETESGDVDFAVVDFVGHRQSGLGTTVFQALPFKSAHHRCGAVLSPVLVADVSRGFTLNLLDVFYMVVDVGGPHGAAIFERGAAQGTVGGGLDFHVVQFKVAPQETQLAVPV